MERNLQRNALVNALILLAASGVVFALARSSHSLTGQISVAFLAIGFLVALISWFQMGLEQREQLEKLEEEERTRNAARATLFTTSDAEVFPARRAREQFEKYLVPGFAILLFVLQGGGALWWWRWLEKVTVLPLPAPLVTLGIFGGCFLVLFLLGQYSARLAQFENERLLQPGANHLLLGAYLCAGAALTIIAVWAEFTAVDLYVAKALCVLLGIIGLETLLGLVLEIYRPRVKGQRARLLYESRFVGLLAHPEGVFTTAAHVLDYQFGFKVSETWFYQFLQKAFGWLLLAQLGILLVSTCFIFLNPGEEALLERFGKPVAGREVLGPGFHAKLPWPIDRVHRFRTQQVQHFTIGLEHEDEGPEEKTVLWTVSHAKEEFNLLVASREPAEATNAVTGKKSPPVNLLSVGVPVQYQISNLPAWAYHHQNASNLLEKLATREVVRYLVSADLNELMSTRRFQAAEELRRRIQAQADAFELGARILFVGLQDVHPPVTVAESYEAVVGAQQKRRANILSAEAHAIRTNALAGAEALRKKRQAEGERRRLEVTALARAAQFTNQIPAYQASPEVYARLAYLQTLQRGSANARKVVMASTNTENVILFNLEEKLRPDLLDVAIPEPVTR